MVTSRGRVENKVILRVKCAVFFPTLNTACLYLHRLFLKETVRNWKLWLLPVGITRGWNRGEKCPFIPL